MAGISCPSTSATSQPKARHLALKFSSCMTSSVDPLICRLLRSMIANSCPARNFHRPWPLPKPNPRPVRRRPQYVGGIASVLPFSAQRHADPNGQPVPQRSGTDFHPGTLLLGWPISRLPGWLKVSSSCFFMKSRSARIARYPSTLCPLLRTKRSRSGSCGFWGLMRMTS